MSNATPGAVLERPSAVKRPRPIPKAKKEGITTDDVKVQQKPDFDFPLNDPFIHPGAEIVIPPEVLKKQYEDALQFAHEPVEIYILPSSEKFGAKTVECWVNGKGIELYDRQTGRWYECGSVPRAMNIITRRKYVEVLLRSKTDDVTTEIIKHQGEDPENLMRTHTAVNFPIQIIRDDSPLAKAWFTQMVNFRW